MQCLCFFPAVVFGEMRLFAAIVDFKPQGFGRVDHHSPISKEDLEKIQSSYNPSSPDPKSFQQVVWFNIMFHLIRCGRQESFATQVDAAGKKFVYQVVYELDKNTGQTINQMIVQGKDVCIKDLRVPTVQLKLLNFIYLS